MSVAAGLVAIVVLMALNIIFVALEFSLVAVDRSEVTVAEAAGRRGARTVSALLQRLSFYLSGAQLGITFTSLTLGVLSEPVVAALLEPLLGSVVGDRRAAAVSVTLAIGVTTAVQMVIGELIPKNVAVARPLGTALSLGALGRFTGMWLRPFIVLLNGAADRIVGVLGVEAQDESHGGAQSRDELELVIEASGLEGTLSPEQARLLTRSMRFRDKTVSDILTPRTAVAWLPLSATGAQLVELSQRTGLSRFPVGDPDLDRVVGVVHVKSLFQVEHGRRPGVEMSDLFVECPFVPESKVVDELLHELRERPSGQPPAYLSVVLDEYGGTAGIVTLEDILEEIVGEIDDEHDLGRDVVRTRPEPDLLSGQLHADELFEVCGFRLPEGPFETLAGLLLERLARIPTAGDVVHEGGWTFEVSEMDAHRIHLVRAVPPSKSVDGTTNKAAEQVDERDQR